MNPGFDIRWTREKMGFTYGPGCFGPEPELRRLDAIRGTLMDPGCDGPQIVYAIAMDLGRDAERQALVERNLLVGAVMFAAGALGREPVRSQGHVHAVSASCGCSTPELYEIWQGEAIIYMQHRAQRQPGACYAVRARAGELVLVPPGWAHMTINADPGARMVFGAFCVRDYGFEYRDVRALGGLCHFPLLEAGGQILWQDNPSYERTELIQKAPRPYGELGLQGGQPLYAQFVDDPDRMLFVSRPERVDWAGFVP